MTPTETALIREFFIIAFSEPQPIGPQAAAAVEHFTFLGYLRENPNREHRFTIAEHLDRIALQRLTLTGKKLRRLGRYMVTTLADPTGELRAAKDELFIALMEDGYICSRPGFYGDDYKPHVTVVPAITPGTKGAHPRKLQSFELNSLSVTESRFTRDYDFLGAEVLHTRNLNG